MKLKYTKFQIALEILCFLLLIGMISFVSNRWNQIPQQIPGHYNAMGEVNRMGNKSEILIMPILVALTYILFTLLSFFPKLWNVPVKITDDNKVPVYCCTRSLLLFTKIETITLFFYITYFMATAQPLPANFLPGTLLILFGTMTFFVIRIIKLGKKKNR